MPTPFEDLYTAARVLVDAVDAVSPTTVTQAPTNYGTDFRITPSQARYQVQISPEKDYGANANATHPRAIVTVLIHHYVSSLANEVLFLHDTMSTVADKLLDGALWRAESGIFDLQPDVDPELEDGGRTGNVITFEISASLLMAPV